MSVVAQSKSTQNGTSSNFSPPYSGFLSLCGLVGFDLRPFQRRIVRLVMEAEREALILLPRGNGKTSLQALVALHHLLTVEDAEVYCCASSRDQARILFQYAQRFARAIDHPNVVHRHLELRWCDDPDDPTVYTRYLRVLAAEAPPLYGLAPSLMFLDEMQALSTEDVYIALSSALHKRPDAKLIVVSTAGQGAESPLGRLRARALGLPCVKRRGFVTEARGPELAMLEWSVPEEEAITPGVVKKANPGPWITTAQIRAAKKSLPELAYRRFVANQWTARIGSWLPAGAWQACANGAEPIPEGSKVWVGVDIGGARADTAIVWIDEDFHVGCRIWSGDEALMDATAFLPALAQKYRVQEIVYDPWRAQTLAKIAESTRAMTGSSTSASRPPGPRPASPATSSPRRARRSRSSRRRATSQPRSSSTPRRRGHRPVPEFGHRGLLPVRSWPIRTRAALRP
jgi:phage terminase large subunit-like protein